MIGSMDALASRQDYFARLEKLMRRSLPLAEFKQSKPKLRGRSSRVPRIR
jgi:hypothetical protein